MWAVTVKLRLQWRSKRNREADPPVLIIRRAWKFTGYLNNRVRNCFANAVKSPVWMRPKNCYSNIACIVRTLKQLALAQITGHFSYTYIPYQGSDYGQIETYSTRNTTLFYFFLYWYCSPRRSCGTKKHEKESAIEQRTITSAAFCCTAVNARYFQWGQAAMSSAPAQKQ